MKFLYFLVAFAIGVALVHSEELKKISKRAVVDGDDVVVDGAVVDGVVVDGDGNAQRINKRAVVDDDDVVVDGAVVDGVVVDGDGNTQRIHKRAVVVGDDVVDGAAVDDVVVDGDENAQRIERAAPPPPPPQFQLPNVWMPKTIQGSQLAPLQVDPERKKRDIFNILMREKREAATEEPNEQVGEDEEDCEDEDGEEIYITE